MVSGSVSATMKFYASLGGLGALAGGVIGLAKGIPLARVLPSASLRTAALFGTISGTSSIK